MKQRLRIPIVLSVSIVATAVAGCSAPTPAVEAGTDTGRDIVTGDPCSPCGPNEYSIVGLSPDAGARCEVCLNPNGFYCKVTEEDGGQRLVGNC